MWMRALWKCMAKLTRSANDRRVIGCGSRARETAWFASFQMRRVTCFAVIAGWMLRLTVPAVGQQLDIEREKIIQSQRPDGRRVADAEMPRESQ